MKALAIKVSLSSFLGKLDYIKVQFSLIANTKKNYIL